MSTRDGGSKVDPTNKPSAPNTVNLAQHRGPLGILLAPSVAHSSLFDPDESTTVIVAGWELLKKSTSDGRGIMGPIQKSGNVRLGDRLMQINGVYVTDLGFRSVMNLIKNLIKNLIDGGNSVRSIKLKSMSFARLTLSHPQLREGPLSFFSPFSINAEKWEVNKRQSNTESHKLYRFSSNICRARLSSSNTVQNRWNEVDTLHELSLPHVEYEIQCHLVFRDGIGGNLFQAQKENGNRIWSIWKRYSEFKALNETLDETYGWRMKTLNNGRGLYFPSEHIFSSILVGTMDSSFVKKRRLELERYWEQLPEEIFDFASPFSHRFSRDMASFLRIKKYFHKNHQQMQSKDIVSNRNNGNSKVDRAISTTNNSIHLQKQILLSNSNEVDSVSQLSTGVSLMKEFQTDRLMKNTKLMFRNEQVREIFVSNIAPPVSNKDSSDNNSTSNQIKRNLVSAKPAFQRYSMDSL